MVMDEMRSVSTEARLRLPTPSRSEHVRGGGVLFCISGNCHEGLLFDNHERCACLFSCF